MADQLREAAKPQKPDDPEERQWYLLALRRVAAASKRDQGPPRVCREATGAGGRGLPRGACRRGDRRSGASWSNSSASTPTSQTSSDRLTSATDRERRGTTAEPASASPVAESDGAKCGEAGRRSQGREGREGAEGGEGIQAGDGEKTEPRRAVMLGAAVAVDESAPKDAPPEFSQAGSRRDQSFGGRRNSPNAPTSELRS